MVTGIGITKKYGALEIVKGVSFSASQNEMVGIVGPSGAGKTTLVQILGTLDKPDQGEVTLDQVDPFRLSPNRLAQFRNQHIGFVFQFHHLLPEFTALENVMLPALISSKTSKKEASQRAMDLLQLVGLESRSKHQPNALSGGEQQRVAVARALMNKPKIMFADEPTGNLDTANALAINQLFLKIREVENVTMVIVTHNVSLSGICDRVLEMRDGQIVDEYQPQNAAHKL